jgi:hypothetical protein
MAPPKWRDYMHLFIRLFEIAMTMSRAADAGLRPVGDFHARYDVLAFPGGYIGALDRIVDGDAYTVEAAICFLEVRPCFLRSRYMFEDLVRKCRRAVLNANQASGSR